MRPWIVGVLVVFVGVSQAQRVSGPMVVEPVVNPDHTATFAYADPQASSVSLALEGVKLPIPMQKSAAGVWTLSTDRLAPGIYGYHFEVDGRYVLDPHTTLVKSSETSVADGFVVPGTPAEPWEASTVPHGVVHQETYTTKIVTGLDQNQSEFYVYTPPGYDARAKTKYPVLYLLHGWSDTAQGWSQVGRANQILDTLIANGKAKPMIVVMPLGYGEMTFVHSGFGVWQDAAVVESNRAKFEQALLTEVLPRVESEYNVSMKREDRAIAGLSMGGLESLTIGVKHADQFAYVGGFSSAVHLLKPDEFASVDVKKANLKLLWVACGTSDDLIKANRSLIAGMKAEGFPVVQIETPGMHTWLVWRENLINFAPLLFQGK